jgi:uncharacterized iron-regulated membrane protein
MLRASRSLHGTVALVLLVLVVVSSATGLALAWKKDIDVLQPPTQRGPETALGDWRGLDELADAATAALAAHLGDAPPERLIPERLDIRPDRGIVKVLFPGTWEVQVEGGTAAVRSVARRHSDWIEMLHDGSIVSEGFKLLSMNVLGLGLLMVGATGFWMWLGPRRLRRARTPSRSGTSARERTERSGAL